VRSIRRSDSSRVFDFGGLSGDESVVLYNDDMHVGLNLVFLVPGESSGPETYARELIPTLLSERPDVRITAFVNREVSEARNLPWRDLVESVTVPVRARRRSAWVLGEQQFLPLLAKRAGVDLVHSLLNTGPAWGPFRRVVTIHDLIYRIYPAAHGPLRTLAMRMLVPLAARTADRIIVPSDTTRRDLIRLLQVPEAKIDLVPEGVGMTPPERWSTADELRRRYDLRDRPFVLTLALKRPHKNLERLLEALALIPRDRRPVLVVVGHATPYERELREQAAILGLEEDLRFLGWVPNEELEGLYRASTCFAFPSLYEGFGLPVLEAMSRGVPVACSGRGALQLGGHCAANPAGLRAGARRLTWSAVARDSLRL